MVDVNLFDSKWIQFKRSQVTRDAREVFLGLNAPLLENLALLVQSVNCTCANVYTLILCH